MQNLLSHDFIYKIVLNQTPQNFIIIFILIIALKQGIYCYKLETNHISRAYSVAAIFKFCATCNVISPTKSVFKLLLLLLLSLEVIKLCLVRPVTYWLKVMDLIKILHNRFKNPLNILKIYLLYQNVPCYLPLFNDYRKIIISFSVKWFG